MKKAIIVDIDGTLAKMNGRGPFEWSRVGEDKVNEPVKTVVNAMKKLYTIIIFTSRDGICLTETINWLIENQIHYDKIFIRQQGNYEKDSVIKRRLYDMYVKDEYQVDFVIDDRNQVVDMWRKDLGLTCFQVDYGDF